MDGSFQTLDTIGLVCKPPAVAYWSVPIGGCAAPPSNGHAREHELRAPTGAS